MPAPSTSRGHRPTRLRGVEHTGRGERAVFDRRNGAWTTEEVRLFDVRYAGRGTAVEFQVNREFGPRAAREHVDFYAAALGRVPAKLQPVYAAKKDPADEDASIR